jgi:Zn-finger nucleic acid-binding protein
MPCPTCSATMARLASDNGFSFFLCPRCGTVSRQGGTMPETYVPKLVERCREFEKTHIPRTSGYMDLWKRDGIAESIHVPGERPNG